MSSSYTFLDNLCLSGNSDNGDDDEDDDYEEEEDADNVK